MKNIEQYISPFIESQFPSFYREEGPLFVLFTKEYFKWLEAYYGYLTLTSSTNFNVGDTVTQGDNTAIIIGVEGNSILVSDVDGLFVCKENCDSIVPITSTSGGSTYIERITTSNYLYQSRNLSNIRDIDQTTEFFLKLFKEKYLKNVKLSTEVYKKTLIKAAHDLFKTKGTERSIDFLFKLVYGTPAKVYYPGQDVINLSDGKWEIPKYLELTRSSRTITYIGREITGSYSGAKAFVERIITRNIKGKIIDIAYLSNVRGEFTRGDIITENGILENAPFVVGSLSDVIMSARGRDFQVGEIVSLTSTNGVSAKARVTSIISQTGIVDFTIIDPGWGFSLDANVSISTKVLLVDNRTNANNSIDDFTYDEFVYQPLQRATVNNITQSYSAGDIVNVTYDSGDAYSIAFDGYQDLIYTTPVAGVFDYQSEDFTIEMYLKPDSENNISISDRLFALSPSIGTQSYYSVNSFSVGISASASFTRLSLRAGNGSGETNVLLNVGYANNYIFDGNWHHLAITYTASTNLFTMYLDGDNIGSNTFTASSGNFGKSTGGYLYLGTSGTVLPSQVFDGLISNFRVSNTLVYSTEFTPTFESLEVTEYTEVLLAASSTISDISTNELVLNTAGSPTVSEETYLLANTANVYVLSVNTNNSNTGTVILGTNGSIKTDTSLIVQDRKYITVDSSNTYTIGEGVIQANSSANLDTSSILLDVISNTVLLAITPGTTSSNGLHVGQFVKQTVTGATGTILAFDSDAAFDYANVNYIVVGNTFGTFSATNTLNVYPTSANLTLESTAVPNTVTDTQVLLLDNITGNSFVVGNSVIGTTGLNRSDILLISDVGGKFTSSVNITASGEVMGINASAIGLISVNNAFYTTEGNFIYGGTSNTYGNVSFVSLGSGASFAINVLDETETVRVSLDLLSGNNDGAGSANTPWVDILVSGANASYGYITSVYIEEGGSGYSNGNVLVFSGGGAAGDAANAVITTNGSGAIISAPITDGGSGYTTSANVAIKVSNTNSSDASGTGASIKACYPLGFSKLPTGDLNYVILDLLTYDALTIGSISSLGSINPGTGYNADPFVRVLEPAIASYNRRDFVLEIDNLNGPGFIVGETVTQVFQNSGVEITANNLAGNTAMETNEYVYTNDGISNVASGYIYSYSDSSGVLTIVLRDVTGTFSNTVDTITLTGASTNTNFAPGDLIEQGATANGTLVSSNTTALVVKDVLGTFTSTGSVTSESGGSATYTGTSSGSAYVLRSLTSNTTSNVYNVEATLSNAIAKAKVKAGSSPERLYLRRISLFTDFQATESNNLIGSSSGSNCSIVSVSIDGNSRLAGYNANVAANVITTTGAIDTLDVFSSGYGFIPFETVTITSNTTNFVASGIANVYNTGKSEGRYITTDGFLDDSKYIFDGDYYQGYSYEVQSKVSFDDYADILKSVLHVAGTKFFGRFVTSSVANTNFRVANSQITTS